MKFKVGDPVWCRCERYDHPHGWFAGVVTGHTELVWAPYNVTIDGITHSAAEEHLRPRRPPPKEQQREQLGEWELCPWQPSQVTVRADSHE